MEGRRILKFLCLSYDVFVIVDQIFIFCTSKRLSYMGTYIPTSLMKYFLKENSTPTY